MANMGSPIKSGRIEQKWNSLDSPFPDALKADLFSHLDVPELSFFMTTEWTFSGHEYFLWFIFYNLF